MKKFIIGALLPLFLSTAANAAILVKSPNGVYTTKATLAAAAAAADAAGKTIVVTSSLTAAMSNISSATVHRWPSDRKLVVEEGGSINNTTIFRYYGKKTPEMFGAKDDSGTTDCTTAFKRALAGGGEIEVTAPMGGYYKIADTLPVAVAGTRIYSKNKAEIKQVTSEKGGFYITASNVTIDGLKLTGPQYAANSTYEKAIYAYGADSSNYLTHIDITNNDIDSWSRNGVMLKYVSNFNVKKNRITNIYWEGISAISSTGGGIEENLVDNVIGTPEAWGIILSRASNDSLVTEPRSADIKVSHNRVYNVLNWNGIDTHGGQRLTFSNNIVYGCMNSISVGAAQNGSAVYTFAPLEVNVTNNVIDSGVTDGSKAWGISFTGALNGATVNQYATGTVTGNTVKNCGKVGGTADRSIYLAATNGMTFGNNSIINPGTIGVHLSNDNLGFAVTGNTITDVWNTDTTADAISATGVNNQGTVSGNTFLRNGKVATYLNRWAVRIVNAAGNFISVGFNSLVNWTSTSSGYLADNSKYALKGDGFNTYSTNGTGQRDLHTQSFPLGYLATNKKIRVKGYGQNTGSAGNKTIKFYLHSTAITVHPANNNANSWSVDLLIWVTGYNSQRVMATGLSGTTIVYNARTAPAVNLATVAPVIKFTGQTADANDTIYNYSMDVSVE